MEAKGEFTQKIINAIKKSGYDPYFIRALKYHLENLKKDEKSLTREDYWKRLVSIMFINQVENYQEPPRYETDIDENIGWPVPVMPVEIFSSEMPPESFRKNAFFKCLDVGHILECQILAVPQTENGYYQLQVIHKYGIPRILHDLHIMVFMPKKKNEVRVFDKKDLLRAVVYEIDRKSKGGPYIYVSVDERLLKQSKRKPSLGLIQYTDLPFYVAEQDKFHNQFSCYADYLKSHPQFSNPVLFISLLKNAFGMDPTSIPSFHPAFNGIKCPEEQTGQALLREAKLNDARFLLENTLKCINDDHYNLALKIINSAVDKCPEDDLLASRLYMQRAKIYGKIEAPKFIKRGFADVEKALRINPEYEEALKAFSHYIYKAANRMYQKKDYARAAELVKQALMLDKSHSSALRLQQRIERRYPKPIIETINLEEESLISLEEKKKQLVTKLKRIGSSEMRENVPETDLLNLGKNFFERDKKRK